MTLRVTAHVLTNRLNDRAGRDIKWWRSAKNAFGPTTTF